MSFLRGSENYVWCTTSVLGKGATGAVFQGVNKSNGEPVAVKTFNQLSHMRPHEVQMREFEVLKKVKHENIVKLLAIEEEQEGRGKVIVMELCTGGSLFNILDDPENTYGLHEREFLLVVEHLTAGMKHLRDLNLVHRDLKPGNIMKFIKDNGTTVYKLTDFGAARELEEDQQFMSLYGTEEYLHPDMYERAVLRKPVGKTFGATVDLWSIGVTLYHVATGNLPFRPFGGRRNKETMFYITTKKASGVIAGTQTSDNGPIEWSRELPDYCQLSAGLKKLITPLLGGLLEVDPHRIWTFDRFFSEVQSALNTKALYIFHVHKAFSLKVFLRLDESYEHFQNYICEQTSIGPESQIILFKDKLFNTVIEGGTPGRAYPETTAEDPLMLFNKNNNNVSMASEPEIPKFPVFPNSVSVENDASQAKVACSIGHVIKRRVEKACDASILCTACVAHWGSLAASKLDALMLRADALAEQVARINDTARALDLAINATLEINNLVNHNLKSEQKNSTPDTESWNAQSTALSREATALQTAARALHTRHGAGVALKAEWETAIRSLQCPHDQRMQYKAKTLVERLRDSWQHLVRDRATRSLTYNDEQFHVLERITVGETGRRARALLQRAAANAAARADALADWYKVAQTVYLQSHILDKDIASNQMRAVALTARLQDAEHKQRTTLSTSVHQLSTIKNKLGQVNNSAAPPPSKVKTVKSDTAAMAGAKAAGMRSLLAAQDDVAASLANNSRLLARISTLAADFSAV